MEEVNNPALLLGREEPLAVMVAVIGGISTQVSLDTVAQGRIVFSLDLGKDSLETVGGVDDARLLIHLAATTRARRGVDRRPAYLPFAEVLSGKEAGAGIRLRAIALKTAVERGRYLVGGQWNVRVHISFLLLFY